MSNYKDPNKVYETGSDDTAWNSKVLRNGERFDVQVFDADGDRRPDREDSFADLALAVAFADKSVLRFSGREMSKDIDQANNCQTCRSDCCNSVWVNSDTKTSEGQDDAAPSAAFAQPGE